MFEDVVLVGPWRVDVAAAGPCLLERRLFFALSSRLPLNYCVALFSHIPFVSF